MSVARTAPPPESRLAPAAPEMMMSPPELAAVTGTPVGRVTVKPTLQSDCAHAGAARVSCPPVTCAVTAGEVSPEKEIASATVTSDPDPVVIWIGAP